MNTGLCSSGRNRFFFFGHQVWPSLAKAGIATGWVFSGKGINERNAINMDVLSREDFLFEDFVLNSSGILSFHGQEVAVPPKELQVLMVLLKNRGSLVLKDQLIDQVWSGQAVGDESLTRCVYSLRRILHESKNNKFIETVYGKGYRFCKSVTTLPSRHQIGRAIKVAVFPFNGAEPGEAAELHARLLDALLVCHHPGLSILPAALTGDGVRLDDILIRSRELQLDRYLCGAFRHESGERALQIELIDAGTHELLARETLKRDGMASWGDRIDAFAGSLASLMAPLAQPAAGVTTNEVRLSHVMARRCLRVRLRGDLHQGLQYLQMGLAQDPLHVPSLTAVAEIYIAMAMHGDIWPEQAYDHARVALEKALSCAPDNLSAQGVLGWLDSLNADTPQAIRCLPFDSDLLSEAAAEVHFYRSTQLSLKADFPAAEQALSACLLRDGSLAPAQLFKLWQLHALGRDREAVTFGETVLARGIQTPRFYGILARVHAAVGQLNEAHRYAALSLEMAPDVCPEIIHHAMVMGYSDRAFAEGVLHTLTQEAQTLYRCPGLLVTLAQQLGDVARARELVQLAIRQRCVWWPFIRVLPALSDFLREVMAGEVSA
jgi:DNA-binding winged helix-turn-helix (wHTH) protein/tetratricopeptide (TPR) repeat protein